MVKLNKPSVDAAKPKNKYYILHDDRLKGFGITIYPSGRKTYHVQYRTRKTGKSRRYSIGPHGVLTPTEARAEATRILAAVLVGGDPVAERREFRQEPTIADLCEAYLEDVESGRLKTRRGLPKSPKTIATDKGRVLRHIKPLMGDKRVSEITRLDVEQFLHDVETGKTADDVPTGPHGRAIVTGVQERREGRLVCLAPSSNMLSIVICAPTIPSMALSKERIRHGRGISQRKSLAFWEIY